MTDMYIDDCVCGGSKELRSGNPQVNALRQIINVHFNTLCSMKKVYVLRV